MDLIKKINYYQGQVFSFIENYLLKKEKIFINYQPRSKEYLKMLISFIKNGKGLRGSLTMIAYELFSKNDIKQHNVIKLASFFEIIHSSLLIHDDVMDNDEKRRGQPTIHKQFETMLKQKTLPQKKYLGQSLAINLGDIGFFLSFKLLNEIDLKPVIKLTLCDFIQDELIKVGLAQMDDVAYSQTRDEPSLDEIMRIYLFKTSRYTFVLPVLSILIINRYPPKIIKPIEKILERLGIIFQITDDQIGLLSDETGKDLGSDIRENKKTIIRYFMINHPKAATTTKDIFGQPINEIELKKIQKAYYENQIDQKLFNLINEQKKEITKIINNNKNLIPVNFQKLIFEFIDYLIKRKK